jgi:peptidyl-prolyl cis-trans isomerase B (cyclophilin B)
VASKRDRVRRLERARAERRMARLAEAQRRRRRVQAGIGGSLALIVLTVGTIWLLGGFNRSSPQEPVTLPNCTWTSRDVTEGVEETGLPSSTVPEEGVQTILINTNLGEIRAVVDVASAHCAAASLDFLSGIGFYNETRCHKLDTALYTLTCGSKTGDDTSSPNYWFPTEGLPRSPLGEASPAPTDAAADPASYYVKGAIVMTNIDVNAVGSQFMIVYGDGTALPNEYTQVATISSGLEFVEQIAAGGAVDASGASAAVGDPTEDLTITSVRITDGLSLDSGDTSPSETPTESPTATPTASS